VALGFGDLFFAAARQELAARARLQFSRTCRIVPGRLGAAGPLIGAAAVGWRGLHGGPPPA
jgi:glucokinase